MSQAFNYRHLYYFWVVAKEGSLSRAAQRLDLAVQTLSTQVRELERALGHALLKPAGRGLVLTEAGQAALQEAEAIFQLGEGLPARVREAVSAPVQRLAVGISNGLPKLAVRKLLDPVLSAADLRLLCHEDQLDDLLAALALHRLDLVLSDRPAPANPNLKLYGRSLGSSPVAWFGTAELAEAAASRGLADLPVLLPTTQAGVRAALDAWFERQGLRPRIVGEFEDAALLATFGASGLGLFPAAEMLATMLEQRYQVRRIAAAEGVEERFYAIGTEKKVSHPLVLRILEQGLPA